ncbi:MAG TPA: hypothetical protein VLT89_10000 [Usitatibacter sp.]|nr:hypothetical protein [Usitatibacter sp.]
MKLDFRTQKWIRYGEIAIVVILLAFALLTYRELDALRKHPVALPMYEFDVSGGADPSGTVTTRGTWIAEGGIPEPIQTTTIQCRYATMHCVESTAAVVMVSGKGLLEATSTQFDIERWDDKQISAKPLAQRCLTRTLVLQLNEKRARSHITPNPDAQNCKEERDRNLELVTGYRVKG